MKQTKLQNLTTAFETIRMKDLETFDEFNTKLSKIENSSFNRGEPIPQSKIVKKILRSLRERFHPKVVAIEEHQDLNSLTVEEFVGNLQTFESNHCQTKKGKDIAFMSSNSIDDTKNSDSSSDLDDAKFDAYFVRKF